MGIGDTEGGSEGNTGNHPDVTIRTLRASEGMRWLAEGFQLFRQQPLGLPAMTVIYLLMHLPALLPGVGLAVATVLAPFATLGLTSACREISRGRAPTPAVYFELFQNPTSRRALFRLGIANAMLTLVAVSIMLLLGLDQTSATPAPQGTAPETDLSGVAWQLALYVPIAVLMWFAPMLADWHNTPPVKALFGSVVACWRNKGAMCVYGLAVTVVVLALATVVGMLVAALGVSKELSAMLVAPLALVMLAVFQAGIYAMYAGIFLSE